MLFEEFTNPIMPERQEPEEKAAPDSEAPEEKAGYSDPELARTLDRVAVAYPYYKRGNESFMKYTQRALKHSEESAQKQSAQIADLSSEIEDIKQRNDSAESHTARIADISREIEDIKQVIAKLAQR